MRKLLTKSFSPLGSGKHNNVPKNECPNEGMNREVRDELR
jgi:hypothetical protein